MHPTKMKIDVHINVNICSMTYYITSYASYENAHAGPSAAWAAHCSYCCVSVSLAAAASRHYFPLRSPRTAELIENFGLLGLIFVC